MSPLFRAFLGGLAVLLLCATCAFAEPTTDREPAPLSIPFYTLYSDGSVRITTIVTPATDFIACYAIAPLEVGDEISCLRLLFVEGDFAVGEFVMLQFQRRSST